MTSTQSEESTVGHEAHAGGGRESGREGWGQESGLCAGVGRCGRSGRALAGALSSGFLNTLTSPAQSWLSLASVFLILCSYP